MLTVFSCFWCILFNVYLYTNHFLTNCGTFLVVLLKQRIWLDYAEIVLW